MGRKRSGKTTRGADIDLSGVNQVPGEAGKKAPKKNGNGATLGFAAQLFLAADKLRKNLEPSD